MKGNQKKEPYAYKRMPGMWGNAEYVITQVAGCKENILGWNLHTSVHEMLNQIQGIIHNIPYLSVVSLILSLIICLI